MLAHGEATKDMPLMEFLGNIMLLIVGGNDTTRNSITGGLIALNENPDQSAKLRANPALLDSHGAGDHPLADPGRPHAPHGDARLRDRRQDHQDRRQGRHVVRLGQSRRDRDRAPRTSSSSTASGRASTSAFGFGIHRCVGMRLAEMQLRIVWEEILKRFPTIEVVGEPVRLKSCFLRSYREMMVTDPGAGRGRGVTRF